MKKPLLFLCFSLLLIFNASAQPRISIAAGLHSTSVSPFINFDTFSISATEIKRSNIHFGFIADIPVNDNKKISFQPGIMYYGRGTTQEQIVDTNKSETWRTTIELKINYIDIPLNFVYKMPLKGNTKFIIGAGPQASLFYSGSSSVSSIDTFEKFKIDQNKDLPVGKGIEQYRVMHFSLNALLGFEFKRAYFTAHYNKSLTPFYEQTNEFKYTSLGATLGVFLGKTATAKKKVEVAQTIDNDRDKDGVINTLDQCPDIAGSIATNGCPDKDGDGITDAIDKCVDLPGTVKNNGCPVVDKDNDGINDELDKCPEVHGTLKYSGCPIPDTDSDGVNDEEDKCINEAGKKENSGCPEIKKEIIEKVSYAARQVNFQPNSDLLTPSSIKVLDEVISLLKETPGINITVEGHSSLDGKPEANLILSQKRGDRVKSYMSAKGINANITAIGYGITEPLSTDKTPAANIMNRRVEIKLAP